MKIIQLVATADAGMTTGGSRVGWWCGDRKVACWALCERDDGSRVVLPLVPNREWTDLQLVDDTKEWRLRFVG